MKRELLLQHECTALASQHGLGGLYELAQHLHEEKAIRRGDAVINMTCSDDPTTVSSFWFSPTSGTGGILQAPAGASHEENGLEGVRFLFAPNEAAAAQAALLSELRAMEADATAPREPAFAVV